MDRKQVVTVNMMHTCPMTTGTVPHVGGPVIGPGSVGVKINGIPIALQGDTCQCQGPPDSIVQGCPGVTINGTPIAVQQSPTAHGGTIPQGVTGVVVVSKNESVFEISQEREPVIYNLQWIKDTLVVRDSKVLKVVTLGADTRNIADGEEVRIKVQATNQQITELSGKVQNNRVEVEWEIEAFEEEQQEEKEQGKQEREIIYVRDLEADKPEAQPNEKVTYKVTKYSQEKVTENDKKSIQWAIKIDGKQEVLKEKGEKLVLTIKEEWAGKEIIVMPFLVKPDEERVNKKTRISDTMNYIVIPEKGTIKKDFSKKTQMEKYRINGRNASELTIKKLLREEKMGNISISKSIEYITSDYNKKYNYNFPDDYYATVGKLLFMMNYHKYMNMSKILRFIRIWYALEESCQLVDGDKGFKKGEGAPLFHIYENVVRKNNDTGIDKLLHFLYSAKYAFLAGYKMSDMLGKAKEFVYDEVYSWFNSNDIGWDNKDIEANELGIKFGKKLQNSIIENGKK